MGLLVLCALSGLYLYLATVVRTTYAYRSRMIQTYCICALMAYLPTFLPKYQLTSLTICIFILNLALVSQHVLLKGNKAITARSLQSNLRLHQTNTTSNNMSSVLNSTHRGSQTLAQGHSSKTGTSSRPLPFNSNNPISPISEFENRERDRDKHTPLESRRDRESFSQHGGLRMTYSTPHLMAVRVNSNSQQNNSLSRDREREREREREIERDRESMGAHLQSMRMTSIHLEVDEDDDKEKDRWKELSLLLFLQGTLFTLLPYVYIAPKIRKRQKVLVRECVFSIMKSAVYLYIINTSWIWLMRCLGGGVHQMLVSYMHQVAYSTVFFIHSACVALFHYQMQKGLLPLLTNDALNVQVAFQDPFLASSAEDFWGHRWGLITRNVMALTVCAPVVHKTESPVISAMAAFVVSGALHAYTIEVVFGVRASHALLFFILHGVAVSLEKYWRLSGGRRPIRIISTVLWLLFGVATLPLYYGTLARASPQWLQAYLPDLGLLSLLKIPEFQCY